MHRASAGSLRFPNRECHSAAEADRDIKPGKACERELQNDLAGALRPVMASLGFFEPLQLATDIDEHGGKLIPRRARA
jgi:hypothetical protein